MIAYELVVEATLSALGEEPDMPGDALSISVCRYRLIRTLSGRFDREEILVGLSYEDRLSPCLHLGERYLLGLNRRFPDHATLLNAFGDPADRGGIYYCALSIALDLSD